jgi:hypothetical protein
MTYLALGRGRRDVLSAFSFKSNPRRRCQRECGVERADIIHAILGPPSRGTPFHQLGLSGKVLGPCKVYSNITR